MRPIARILLAAAGCALLGGSPAEPKVFMNREKALELVFGERVEFRRETLFPTGEQIARARALAGSATEIREAPLTRYTAWRGGDFLGAAYLDTHRVRTLPQTVLVFITPEGKLRTLEILSFGEPEEYLPRKRWLDQFRDRALSDELAVGGGVHGMTGATLSAHAVTEAARRVLALHLALEGRQDEGGQP